MALAQLIVSSAIALIVAGVGLYAANSFRLQTRIRLLEARVEAYRKLFEITEMTSPTRLGRGETLSEDDAKVLGKAIYDWYYENGSGLLMPNRTRLLLQEIQQTLQGEKLRRLPDDPMLRKVAELRHALRRDVGVFASDEAAGFTRAEGRRKLRRRAADQGGDSGLLDRTDAS